MKIDKVNDEFIVDCTNNTTKERQQVLDFLIKERNYNKNTYRSGCDSIPIIACKIKEGSSFYYELSEAIKKLPNLPIYSFEQFKEMYLEEEFTLPKKWCVKVTTENAKLLGEFYAKYSYEGYKRIFSEQFIGKYVTSHNVSSGNSLFSECPGSNFDISFPKNDFVEITIEQFKKHVLKQTEMEKEIEYYLCKKTCWGNNGTKWNKNDKLYSTNLESLPYFKEIGLINNPEFWEAIYKEEFKVGDWVTFWSEIDKKLYSSKIKEWTPHNYCKLENGLEPFKHLIKKATPEEIEKASKTIVKMYSSNKGEFEIEIVGKKAYYRPENKELTKYYLESILDMFKTDFCFVPYTVNIDSVKIGCMEGVKKEDIRKVYDLIK